MMWPLLVCLTSSFMAPLFESQSCGHDGSFPNVPCSLTLNFHLCDALSLKRPSNSTLFKSCLSLEVKNRFQFGQGRLLCMLSFYALCLDKYNNYKLSCHLKHYLLMYFYLLDFPFDYKFLEGLCHVHVVSPMADTQGDCIPQFAQDSSTLCLLFQLATNSAPFFLVPVCHQLVPACHQFSSFLSCPSLNKKLYGYPKQRRLSDPYYHFPPHLAGEQEHQRSYPLHQSGFNQRSRTSRRYVLTELWQETGLHTASYQGRNSCWTSWLLAETAVYKWNFFFWVRETSALLLKPFNSLNQAHPDYLE